MSAFVGFEQADLGVLEVYRKKQLDFWNLYGQKGWALQYQADVRCRLEHFEVVHRDLRAKYEEATAAGLQPMDPYNPARPWNSVFQKVVTDFEFWHEELERPADRCLKSPDEFLGGDAPVASARGATAAPGLPSPPPDPRGGRGAKRQKTQAADRPPKLRSWERAHIVNDEGTTFTSNRKGVRLCADFQTGQCSSYRGSSVCPRDSSQSHQCSKCLDTRHGGEYPQKCTQVPKQIQTPTGGGWKGGKGGKGGGRGKGSGRWQY